MMTQSTEQTVQFIPLSPLDNIMPPVYTRIILCIQTEENTDPSTVTERLSKGLRKTVEQVPFLDGEVVPDTTKADRLGRSAVRVSRLGRLQLQVKDLTKRSDTGGRGDWKWSFQELVKENWRPGLLDGNILSPVAAFPDPFGDSPPVMAAQASFIEGGLLLCAAFHHQVTDGTSTGTILRLWAQNCRELENVDHNVAKIDNDLTKDGENAEIDVKKKVLAAPTSAIVITAEALDRTPLMPTGPTDEVEQTSRRQHPEYCLAEPQATEPSTKEPAGVSSIEENDVEIFYFSADALTRLKAAAKSDLSATVVEPPADVGGGVHAQTSPWISTNDALCALLWSSITRARLRQSKDDAVIVSKEDGEDDLVVVQLESKLGMANNGRRKLHPPLWDEYVGNVNLYSLSVLPISALMREEALPNVAKAVRASVNTVNDEHIRTAIRFIDSLPDIAALQPTFAPACGIHLAITSWAEMGLNGLDWGLSVGKVERVRVPDMKFDGLCIILPRRRDGGLEVLVGLTSAAMQRLTREELFMRFAQVFGPPQDHLPPPAPIPVQS